MLDSSFLITITEEDLEELGVSPDRVHDIASIVNELIEEEHLQNLIKEAARVLGEDIV